MSLAHTELYYNQFNDFIGDNLQLLDDQSFGFMKHCMALLSLQNKQRWLKMKMDLMRWEKQVIGEFNCIFHTEYTIMDI